MTDLVKQIEELEKALSHLELVMNSLDMPGATKQGIEGMIKGLISGLDAIKQQHGISTPSTSSNLPATQARRAYNNEKDIQFNEFMLIPETQEIGINGKRHYLPQYEFNLLWNLAVNNGKPVQFKQNASLQTHLSVLRRTYPILKSLIETNGKGIYTLHCTKK